MTAVKKQIPNILTTLRGVCSLEMIFCESLSLKFIILYIIADITDMLDRFAAIKLNAVSFFGERYDSTADVLFTGICLFKRLPVLNLKIWHIVWVILIAVIKGSNIMFSYLYHRKKQFLHSTANRIAGFMLLEDYERLCHDRNNGHLLTSDGLRFICEAYHYDAEIIGQHFLEELPRICPKKEQ